MIVKLFLVAILSLNALGDDVKGYHDEFDVVLGMLLNGEGVDAQKYDASDDEEISGGEPVYSSGIWKCGQCDSIDDSKLIYNELYEVDSNVEDEGFIDLQIGMSLQDMQCVTVSSGANGAVQRVAGACDGDDVTLRIAHTQRTFNVNVYGY